MPTIRTVRTIRTYREQIYDPSDREASCCGVILFLITQLYIGNFYHIYLVLLNIVLWEPQQLFSFIIMVESSLTKRNASNTARTGTIVNMSF